MGGVKENEESTSKHAQGLPYKLEKRKKGDFGYLPYRKKFNLLLTAAAFIVVFAVLFSGILIFDSRVNYMTVLAVVLVLPAAKIAVSYFILLPHQPCSPKLYEDTQKRAKKITAKYDLVVSNSKNPVGVCAAVITDRVVAAYTVNKKADRKLFETSVKEFLKNDRLGVSVTLYTEEKQFLNRVNSLSDAFDDSDRERVELMRRNAESFMGMCL